MYFASSLWEVFEISNDSVASFDSEFSLGIVDCKLESVKEYSDIFDYILSNYCVLLVEGGNYVGI